MVVFRVIARVSMILSLSLILLAPIGCGSPQGDIGEAGYVPDDIPADSDAALAEIEAAEEAAEREDR